MKRRRRILDKRKKGENNTTASKETARNKTPDAVMYR